MTSSSPEPALFRALPALRERVPWVSLGRFPTRVARVEGLVSPSVELWVKHDDESGIAYGGNKVRKLEFLLAEAQQHGAARIATVGAIGSHHVLASAIYGAQLGFAVDAVVFPQPLTAHVREQILADLGSGASLRPTRGYAGVPWAMWRARRAEGCHWIAAGGSSPTGTLGYASGGCEVIEQIERGELPRPDVVYLPIGSNGTTAGLFTSLWSERPIEIVAVRVTESVVASAGKARRLAAATEARIVSAAGGWPRRGQPPTLRVVHDQFGGAYGRATPASDEAVARAGDAGLRLEPTYTGKCMAALLADARAGRLDGKRVLFWHTFSSVDLSSVIARAPATATLPALLRRYFD